MEIIDLHITPSRFTPKRRLLKSASVDVNIGGIDTTLEFIFDRTQVDVEYVKELTSKLLARTATPEEEVEYESDLIGALNRSDLVRIKQDIYILSVLLNVTIINAAIPEIPDTTYFASLRYDLQQIRDTRYCQTGDIPNVPSQPLNGFQKWNAIEKILYEAIVNYIVNNELVYYISDHELYTDDNAII